MDIPMIPDHPRFRCREETAEFLAEFDGWADISTLEFGLENCCAVACMAFLSRNDWLNAVMWATYFEERSAT